MRPMLEIKNLHVDVDGKKILNGLDLVVEKGTVHAIMGPNGSGKSTLAHVLAGKPAYVVTEGQVLLDGEDILALPPDERAARGLFLAFQYPMEIPGVASFNFLRTAINAQRKKRGEAELTVPEIMKRVREAAGKLDIDQDMLFYCRQRGLSQEEAVALVVNGFVKDVLQQLPMEFAVEAQKLISISLEGSVG